MHDERKKSDIIDRDLTGHVGHNGGNHGHCHLGTMDRVLANSRGHDALYELEECVHCVKEVEVSQKKNEP